MPIPSGTPATAIVDGPGGEQRAAMACCAVSLRGDEREEGREALLARIRELEADRERDRLRIDELEGLVSAASASRDAFLATASHELRNAVAVLVLSLGAIEKGLAAGNTGRIAKNLDSSKRSVALLRGLLDDMQDGARFRTGPVELCPGPADLAAIARNVVRATAGKADRAGVPVSLSAPESLEGVWDVARIERAAFHLVLNAIRYGGKTPVEVAVIDAGATAILEVRDRGPGIAPADRARIFEPFVRLAGPTASGGLGLGLFIARCCVEAHGGTIAVEGAPGAGTTFRIELPKALR
jgi:signal transduction histidine kinase